jgi:polyphosphate kinase
MALPRQLPEPPPDLTDPRLYIPRIQGLLEFNRRVLEQAKDPAVPLLERLRFLTICSGNLDEFFEIRVARLKQEVASGIHTRGPDGLTSREALHVVAETAHTLVAEQYRVLQEEVLPSLERHGIRFLDRALWTVEQRRWIKRHFTSDVLPLLTPVGLDPAHPFPQVLNKGLSFLVALEGHDAFGRSSGTAVLQVPRPLPRLLALPRDLATGPYDFVPLSAIIQAHVGELFPGMKVAGCYPFRITRNSELWVDEEEVENLLLALKGELPGRNYGAAVRLEVGKACPEDMAQFLLRKAQLEPEDLYRVDGPVNLNRLSAVPGLVDRPELKYVPFEPGVPPRLKKTRDLFEVVREGDVLLHHPYESFGPVLELVRQAAADPHVLAIKQTLYRTGADSPLVAALYDAARAGKEVTVVVELRARFDEAANIELATRLQQAGANLVYGIVGYKAHSKMLLIVRREGKRLRRYVHLGTGNYHTLNARTYTDLGYITCEPGITEDVHKLFLHLTGLGQATQLKRVLQSPFHLHTALLELIAAETEEAEKGRPARIVAKMNALSEPEIIRALYRASRAGVEIDLIVRGICCLRPGVPGVSDRIRVRSVIGRFLEHSRVYWFHAKGEGLTFCSSADWMERNLFHRVETAFQVEDPALRRRLIAECLDTYLEDNCQAWLLQPDGTYRRATPGDGPTVSAQQSLLGRLAT